MNANDPHVARRREAALAAAVFVAFLVIAAALVAAGSVAPPEVRDLRADRVVIVAVSPLGWGDLGRGLTPNLDEMARTGGVASMSVRTASRVPSDSEGFLSVGGGGRLDTGCDDDDAVSCDVGVAYEASARVGPGTAADLHEARTGRRVDGGIVAPGAVRTARVNSGTDGAGRPGALGDALHAAGRTTAVVANADQPATVNTRGRLDRSAALAVVDGGFHVDQGAVRRAMLRPRADAPFGVELDREQFGDEVGRAMGAADVVVVDPGELTRAERFAPLATSTVARRHRDEALATTDAIVGEVRRRAGRDTVVIATAVEPPDGALTVTPLLVSGPAVPPGWLWSSSTKREGVVAIGDLAPTVLGILGIERPDDLPGAVVAVAPSESGRAVDLRAMRRLDRDTRYRERTYGPQCLMFVAATVALCLVASGLLGRRPRRRGPATGAGAVELPRPPGRAGARLLRQWSLALAAAPVTGFLLWTVPGIARLGPWVAMAGAAVAVLLAAVASTDRRLALAPVVLIEALTLAVIVLDVVSGTRLHLSSWLGYSLHGGGRFYGIPNTTFAVLGAATLVVGCAIVERCGRRPAALAAVAGLFVLVVVVDGAPMLGGDVGGILTLVPVFGLTGWALSGRAVRARVVGLVAVLGAVVVVGAAAVDLARPPAARTHLGRFAARLVDDPANLLTVLSRKQSANFRILHGSIWTWAIPAVIVLVAWVVVGAGRWRTTFPPGSPWRVALLAILGAAVLGFATNDSGPVVVALFAVPVIPVVVLATLDDLHRGDPDGPQLRHP